MIDPVSFGLGAFLVWGIWVVSVAVKEYHWYKKRNKSMENIKLEKKDI